MSSVPFYVLDSFTRKRYAGNPAGVVLPDRPLSESQMRGFAGEMHLETAFVSPSDDPSADYIVAYYTGVERIPLCGHDTIALATVLAHTGAITLPATVRLATDVGIIAVSIGQDQAVTMDLAPPQYGDMIEPAEAAEALGLPLTEITDTGLPVQIVSTGNPFLILPVARRSAISALAPDMNTLIAYGDGFDAPLIGFYVWTLDTEGEDAQVHARCFCPAVDLPEDPVTGTASGAVGAYLARHGQLAPASDGSLSFRTEQGMAMGRPGHVDVRMETEGNAVTRVQVRGYAALVAEGQVWI